MKTLRHMNLGQLKSLQAMMWNDWDDVNARGDAKEWELGMLRDECELVDALVWSVERRVSCDANAEGD